MRGLYVHVPFCRSKCGYCDFASEAGREELIPAWLRALGAEAARYGALKGTFGTLYVGGGTPSLLTEPQLAELVRVLEGLAGPLAALQESTFEANPESLTAAKAGLLKAAGFGRASLGLQASQDRLLEALGRPGRYADFLRAYEALRRAGFANVNVDLMSGLPGQSEADFEASLEALLALKPEHVSFYALEVHEGTPFHAAGVKEAPEAAAAMYEKGAAALQAAGLRRYEISNFSLPGRESRHNLNYWEQGEYLGLGPAAASYLDGERRASTASLDAYLKAAAEGAAIPLQYSERLSGRDRAAERAMLGLRKTSGIELTDDIFIEFGREIDRLLAAGLIEKKDGRLRIKEDKFYLSNAVFREFV